MLEDRVRKIEQFMYDSQMETKNAIAVDRKLQQRVETQTEGLFGMYTALCVSTIDPLVLGRIRIYTPALDDPDIPIESCQFASPISVMGGFDDSGSPWVPPAGSRVAILFHGGNRASPYYIGTIWESYRGADNPGASGATDGHWDVWNKEVPEYTEIWDGRRNGYNFGMNNGSEVKPPWNTEGENTYDNDSTVTFFQNPKQFASITTPNIYGLKTNMKHYLKFVDGDPYCNRRWMRAELASGGGGGIMLFKDDHLHPCGQWAFGNGPPSQCDEEPCCVNVGTASSASSTSSTSSSTTIPSTPESPNQPSNPAAAAGIATSGIALASDVSGESLNIVCVVPGYPSFCGELPGLSNPSLNKNEFINPFYKRSEEMRLYDGAPTPMNNKCQLPQTGVQIQSMSGHQFVMDDSVEQPTGTPYWDRVFDFGCNDVFTGKTFWRSTTGHLIEMNDSEEVVPAENGSQSGGRAIRSIENGIKLITATGNRIIMSDDTIQEGDSCDCPPNYAGVERGISMQSTSNHVFQMIDQGLQQCTEPRVDGGIPAPCDKHGYDGYVLLRSGYGLQLLMKDKDIQTETYQQYIELLAPQKDNTERGPHIFVMQEVSDGPGLIMLRAGGVYYINSYDDSIEVVGFEGENAANKIVQVTDNYIVDVRNYYYNHTNLTCMFAEEYMFLLAGRDCPAPDSDEQAAQIAQNIINNSNKQLSLAQATARALNVDGDTTAPNAYQAIVAANGWQCPLTNFMHFGLMKDVNNEVTYDARSARVFISGPKCPDVEPISPLNDPDLDTSDYTTAGGNPPDTVAGGEPFELPDYEGQNALYDVGAPDVSVEVAALEEQAQAIRAIADHNAQGQPVFNQFETAAIATINAKIAALQAKQNGGIGNYLGGDPTIKDDFNLNDEA